MAIGRLCLASPVIQPVMIDSARQAKTVPTERHDAMTEKTWSEMTGWQRAWKITEVVAGVAAAVGVIALACAAGPAPRPPRVRSTVFRPRIYRPTGGPKGWRY